jgi:hypothetical protein
MGAEELRRYQIHLLHERKLALGTVENCISALRFLYSKTLKRRDLAFDDLASLSRELVIVGHDRSTWEPDTLSTGSSLNRVT